jgi:hypothetical protein
MTAGKFVDKWIEVSVRRGPVEWGGGEDTINVASLLDLCHART